MTHIITRALIAVLLFAGVGISAASAQSVNLSDDPVHAESYKHYCPPYTETFVQNGVYSPTDRSCIYSIPTDVSAMGNRTYMLFYAGTPGSATLLRSEPVNNSPTPPTLVQVQSFGPFGGVFPIGSKFFGVVVPSGPQVGSSFPELQQFNQAFTTGAAATPHSTYHLLEWELGEYDLTGPSITVTSPAEGATYTTDDVVPLLATIEDPAGVQDVLYIFNNEFIVQAGDPLPLNLITLGPVFLSVEARDNLGNTSYATVNFTVTTPTVDVCPGVPGPQESGPCADLECLNAGGTWNGSSCDFPPPPMSYTVEFLQPINYTGHQITANTSVFKAGSTIPVKFVVKDPQGNPVQVAGIIPWIVPVKGPTLNAPVSEPVYTEQPSSGNQYDRNGGHYQYNWKTPKNGTGFWHYLYIVLPDGSIHSTIIGLR